MDRKNHDEDIPMKPLNGPVFVDEMPTIEGSVKITIRKAKTGEVEKVIDLKNIVVTNTRIMLSRLISGDFLPVPPDDVTRYIGNIGFGTSGIAPQVTDLNLTAPVVVAISSVEYPTTTSVKFIGTLGTGDGNGVQYQEVGLLFINPAQLATRRTFPAMYKSSAWEWEVQWVLSFV